MSNFTFIIYIFVRFYLPNHKVDHTKVCKAKPRKIRQILNVVLFKEPSLISIPFLSSILLWFCSLYLLIIESNNFIRNIEYLASIDYPTFYNKGKLLLFSIFCTMTAISWAIYSISSFSVITSSSSDLKEIIPSMCFLMSLRILDSSITHWMSTAPIFSDTSSSDTAFCGKNAINNSSLKY